MQVDRENTERRHNRIMAFVATPFRKLVSAQQQNKKEGSQMGAFQYIA